MRLKQRLIVLPEGTDIVSFVEHDGTPPNVGPTLAEIAPRKTVTLGQLKDRYLSTYANGTIEANSLETCKLHLNHFLRALGDRHRPHGKRRVAGPSPDSRPLCSPARNRLASMPHSLNNS